MLRLDPALVAFCPVVNLPDLRFIKTIALRDVVVIGVFEGPPFAGQFFAALPVVAIDNEDVLDVEVIGVDFIAVLLILFV